MKSERKLLKKILLLIYNEVHVSSKLNIEIKCYCIVLYGIVSYSIVFIIVFRLYLVVLCCIVLCCLLLYHITVCYAASYGMVL